MENEISPQTPAESMQPEQPSPESAKPKRFGKSFWIKVAVWFVVAAVVALVVFGVGIYRLGWKGPFVTKVENILPYPIAVVNGRFITIKEFGNRFTAFEKAIKYNQDFDFNDPKNAETVKQQKDALLQRLIDLELEKVLADRRNIVVTSEDVDKELTTIATQSGIEMKNMDSLLDKVYGWSRADFVNQVVTPQIRERKLQVQVSSDKDVNADAYKKIEEVKKKLADGGDFAKLAAEYSDDTTTKATGGDLGWTSNGTFVPEFETAANALEKGKTSEIISTQFGYHIIQLLERSLKDGKEMIHTRHILVTTKKFPDWLEEQKKDAKIWKLQVS